MNSVLDTILSSMEAPPQATKEQRKRAREESERRKKQRLEQRQEVTKFRREVEKMVAKFQTTNDKFLEFEPLDKMFRAVIYEIAEITGLMACSYGVDQIDRYTVVYHKNAGPSDDERYVRNNGGKWNDEVAALKIEERRMCEEEGVKPRTTYTCQAGRGGRARLFVPNGPSYTQKYMHLSTLPEKTAEENTRYGEVPSQLKRDHRSIEETLKDIKDKKKKTKTSKNDAGDNAIVAN